MACAPGPGLFGNLQIRDIWPFYITGINPRFLGDHRGGREPLAARGAGADVASVESFRAVLNRTAKRLACVLGSKQQPLFAFSSREDSGDPQFVVESPEAHDLRVVGDELARRRFVLRLAINPDSYLHAFAHFVQVTFCFDARNRMVAGAISLNRAVPDYAPAGNAAIREAVYVSSLCRYFLANELKKASVASLLALLEDVSAQRGPDGAVRSEARVKARWMEYAGKKTAGLAAFADPEALATVFDCMFVCQGLMLSLYESLRAYVQAKRPEDALRASGEQTAFLNVRGGASPGQDLASLIVHMRTVHTPAPAAAPEGIETASEALDFIAHQPLLEDQSLWSPIPAYEITRTGDAPFDGDACKTFLGDPDFMLFFLMASHPELFGLHTSNTNFSPYAEAFALADKISFSDPLILASLRERGAEALCEANYDYATFVNAAQSFLIVKNDNPATAAASGDGTFLADPNARLYDTYLWAIVYNQARAWRLRSLEDEIRADKIGAPWRLRGLMAAVEKLSYSETDDFYGLPEIKKIVKKIDSTVNMQAWVAELARTADSDDQRYGKSKERAYLTAGVLAAGIFGLLDFFTCVYTITAVDPETLAAAVRDPQTQAFIGVGSALAFVLLCVLAYVGILALRARMRAKRSGG